MSLNPNLIREVGAWDPTIFQKPFNAIEKACNSGDIIQSTDLWVPNPKQPVNYEPRASASPSGSITTKAKAESSGLSRIFGLVVNGVMDLGEAISTGEAPKSRRERFKILEVKFAEELELAEKCVELYRYYLKTQLKDRNLNNEEMDNFRKCKMQLNQWFEVTIFLRQIINNENDKIAVLFKKYKVEFKYDNFSEHRKLYKLIILEDKLNNSTRRIYRTDYAAIYKTLQGWQTNNDGESDTHSRIKRILQESLKAWVLQIHTVNSSASEKERSAATEKDVVKAKKIMEEARLDRIKPHLLHRSLHILTELSLPEASKDTIAKEVAKLEANFMMIEETNKKTTPSLFSEFDHTYLRWRDTIGPGKEIEFPTLEGALNKVKLGNELGQTSRKNNKHRVFTIEGNADYVVRIGPNECYLSIIKNVIENNQLFIPCVEHKAIGTRGVALVEKADRGLGGMRWETKGAAPIVLNDINAAKPLIKLGQEMMKNWKIPDDFCTDKLLVKNGSIVSTTPIINASTFDFSKLEEVIRQYAGDNLPIYKHIVTQCKMKASMYAKTYREVVGCFLSNPEQKEKMGLKVDINLKDKLEIAPEIIGRMSLIPNATQKEEMKAALLSAMRLYDDVQILREACKEQITLKYVLEEEDKEKMMNCISLNILKMYDETYSMSKLWPMRKEVCKEVVKEMVEDKKLSLKQI